MFRTTYLIQGCPCSAELFANYDDARAFLDAIKVRYGPHAELLKIHRLPAVEITLKHQGLLTDN